MGRLLPKLMHGHEEDLPGADDMQPLHHTSSRLLDASWAAVSKLTKLLALHFALCTLRRGDGALAGQGRRTLRRRWLLRRWPLRSSSNR